MKTQTTTLEEKLDQQLVDARKESIKRLNNIEHRLEFVEEINGVEFVNDAKAADINSSWYSIDCMDRPVVWIVSSCPHEEDYSLFREIDTDKVKALIVLGKNPEALYDLYKGDIATITRAYHLHDAVKQGMKLSEKGDVVLYSPAFTDFDDYVHYKENGQHFRKAVREVRL